MIVMKFGGTSVENAEAIHQTVSVIEKHKERRPVVVLSAMAGVTNALLEIADLSHRGRVEQAQESYRKVRDRHLNTLSELFPERIPEEVSERLEEMLLRISEIIQGLSILGECTPRSQDALVSFGERLSTWIVASYLRRLGKPAEWLDSRRLMRTDDRFSRAQVLEGPTHEALRKEVAPVLERGGLPVLQGFIGSTLEGVTTTIGRGGSDYTASVVAAALGAKDIQIWTDVPGILTADPRVVQGVYKIRNISFAEASELAYFGAKVLFPATLLPAVRHKIPLHVRNTMRPDDQGTLISLKPRSCRTPVKSIAHRGGITVLNVHSTRMLMAHGFLRRIFETFDRNQTVVDVVSTSEVNVSLSIDSTVRIDSIRAELERIGEVSVESGMAVVCVVGENIRYVPGISARVFGALKEINVQMISQGASKINLTFIVREADVRKAVRRLHQEFFREPDPEIFEPIPAGGIEATEHPRCKKETSG